MLIFDFQDHWSVPPFGALDLWLSVWMYASVIIFFTNLRFYASHILITMRWWDIADSWDAPWGPSKFSQIMYSFFVSPHKKQKRNWPNTNEQTIYWMQDALYTTFVNKPQFHNSRSCNEFELYSIFYPDCVLENLDSLNDGTTRRNWRETDTGV